MGIQNLADICDRHRVKLLLQHGSTVAGRVHSRSDLDMAALFDGARVPLTEVASLSADMQGLYPGQDLDIAVINHADPLFLKKVLERCELLYGSPRVLAELRMYAFRRFQDHRRFLALEQAYVQRTLERLAAR